MKLMACTEVRRRRRCVDADVRARRTPFPKVDIFGYVYDVLQYDELNTRKLGISSTQRTIIIMIRANLRLHYAQSTWRHTHTHTRTGVYVEVWHRRRRSSSSITWNIIPVLPPNDNISAMRA